MYWDESKTFKILSFFDSYIDVPMIKKLSNLQLLKELPFYDELNMVKNKTPFSGYAQSYKTEIIDKKDVIIQLKSSEISIRIFRLENWISHGSGWNVDNILNQYLNISSYKTLSGTTYCKLPKELSHPMKGLINIQNDDNKCFLWCHVRYLNCNGKYLFRITKEDTKISIMMELNFPFLKKIF